MKYLYSVFAVTIFLSSFLLFQVQPLIGKHILPWYGGSSAVWVTAMLFFMVALTVGYLYALALSKLKLSKQVLVHTIVILGTVILLKEHAAVWPSAITPLVEDLSLDFSGPVLAVFKTLLITIGLPFALLSSSSSLLQMWYQRLSGREPFFLYGISNIGSLLGLLSYPLFFERFFSTFIQGKWWAYGLIVYVGLLLIILYLLLIFGKKTTTDTVNEKEVTNPGKKSFLIWTGLAALPVMVMLSGTSFMTVSIAPIPLLWVGPLALYLLSFIVTFRDGKRLPVWVNEIFVVIAVVVAVFIVAVVPASVWVSVLLVHVALFSIYHWCHEHLYALRPHSKYLTLFYVALAFGGILGSLLIKLSSAYFLVIPIELMVIFIGSVLFILASWFYEPNYYFPFITQFQLRLVSGFLALAVIVVGWVDVHKFQKDVSGQYRNFFGYKAVYVKEVDKDTKTISLLHGMTNHGFQMVVNDEPLIVPSSYYGKGSGVASAFSYSQSFRKNNKVAVIGLGSGALAAYCRPEDNFSFFEIDKQVIDIAKNNFTFLQHCPQHDIILGDARLELEKISKTNEEGGYNLIIIDAYADDTIPVHLMTVDAFAMYKELLAPEGVIAVHISSRYLDLLPVIGANVEENDMQGRYWFNNDSIDDALTTPSLWALLSKDKNVFAQQEFVHMNTFADEPDRVIWTDVYSALLPVIK